MIFSLKQLLIPAEEGQAEYSICSQVASKALEMLLGSLKDHVPNVRFAAVQVRNILFVCVLCGISWCL